MSARPAPPIVIGGGPWPALGTPPPEGNSDASGVCIVFATPAAQVTSSADWITIQSVTTAPGVTIAPFRVTINSGDARDATLTVTGGANTTLPITQSGVTTLAQQVALVLNPPLSAPRGPFPLAMELGIAGKFIAQQIKKAGPEAWPVLLPAVSAAVAALAAMAIGLRSAFRDVPDPPDYLPGTSPMPGNLPMTDVLILEQAKQLIQYINEEVVEGT